MSMEPGVSSVPRQIFSPTELAREARLLVESSLGLVWLEGEISNFTRAASGHLYFALKDSGAQLRCAMFRPRAMLLRIKPTNGMQVLARGRVSVYEARGDLQLIVEHIEEAGLGRLQRELDALKARLAAEGLLDPARKRPIPRCPRHLAIVSSPTGAALQDVLAVLQRRWPLLQLTVYPSRVQGSEAAAELNAALQRAVASHRHDLILLTRGGGSMEDLWAFNDETLARAIAACPVPVVSAVGHETDTTLADLVADLRAATPTAAAELISPDQADVLARLDQAARRLERSLLRRIQTHAQNLDRLQRRIELQQPSRRLQTGGQLIDALLSRLERAKARQFELANRSLFSIGQGLQRCDPARQLPRVAERLSRSGSRLQRAIDARISALDLRLSTAAAMLSAMDPQRTLARGYAIVRDESGRVLDCSTHVEVNDALSIRLARGVLTARVLGKTEGA